MCLEIELFPQVGAQLSHLPRAQQELGKKGQRPRNSQVCPKDHVPDSIPTHTNLGQASRWTLWAARSPHRI